MRDICWMWSSKRRGENGSHTQTPYHCFGPVKRLSSFCFHPLRLSSKYLESGMLSLGETGELSPNASAMLRISTLSAWAQLQISSFQQQYLENVVKPYRQTLCSLWIAALRDYACIRIDSEFLHDTSSVALDSSYSNLGREVLLPVSSCHTVAGAAP
jgi:hypothetical protein